MDEENDALMNQFIRQMLMEKGMDDMPEDMFEQMVSDLKEKLVYYINRNIIAQLPAEQRHKLDVSIDDKTADFESVNKIVEESGIDVEPIIQQTLIDFKEQYLKGGETEEQPEAAEAAE